jgi:hypothetical protein
MLGLKSCGSLLSGKPFFYADAPIENLPADKRPRWAHAKYIPTIERARVPPQFGGEFFSRQKFR